MKHLKLTLPLLLICFFILESSAQSKEIVKIEQAVEGLRKAMVEPTQSGLEQYVTDQLSYGHSGGKIESKSEFIENLLQGGSNFTEITLSDQKIDVFKKTAVVRHNFYAKTHDKGKEASEVSLHIMTVWVKDGKNWKMMGRQAVKKQK